MAALVGTAVKVKIHIVFCGNVQLWPIFDKAQGGGYSNNPEKLRRRETVFQGPVNNNDLLITRTFLKHSELKALQRSRYTLKASLLDLGITWLHLRVQQSNSTSYSAGMSSLPPKNCPLRTGWYTWKHTYSISPLYYSSNLNTWILKIIIKSLKPKTEIN